MQRRASLVQSLFAALALSPFVIAAGCAQPASGGGTGGSNGNGGSNSGNGGSNNRGGSNGAGGSNSGNGGSHTGGSNGAGGVTSAGGSNGSGGSNTGSGGSNTGAGGSNTGSGGSHTGGTTGTGGNGTGTGGNGSGGSGMAGSSGRACGAPASGDVVADFEEGFNQNVVQGGRQGWWSAFGDTTGTQTPAAGTTGPVAAAAVSGGAPSGDSCDMYAFHSTGTGHNTSTGYVGFAAPLNGVIPPPASGSKTMNSYDVSGYDGISFNVKSGSGTAPPVWVEFQNTSNVPSPDGTATHSGVDQFNTRGILVTNIGTSWTTVYVPFALTSPRYLPNLTESDCSDSNVFCQAPPWDSKNTLKIQFGIYPQFGVAPFASSTNLNYDLWVDDVTLYKGNNGLGTWTPTPSTGTAKDFPVDNQKVGSCTRPAAAAGKYLVQMYNTWKKTFVTGSGSSTRVIRPENANDTVSEGIGYGMLIAVNMGDKALFDALWSYEAQHREPNKGTLMTWCIPGGGGGSGSSCSPPGGSATDADEDMAFALIQAGKHWGGTYAADAKTLIGYIGQYEIDSSTMLPNGGSNFTAGSRTNPSYWAPAYYRVFATVDSSQPWTTIASNTYTALNAIAGKSTGNAAGALVPAWCSGTNCGNVDGGSYTDGAVYQYDAHRVAWRFGLDACWNGGSTPFLAKNAGFFANLAKAGVGRIVDIYTLGGTPNGDAAPNSMSAVGTAGVGAMASSNSFADTAWQFLLDASYSPNSVIKDTQGHIGYTYFNATVGLLTALTLSGNFNNF